MVKFKIIVVKKTLNKDLAKKYCGKKPATCSRHNVGDVFIAGRDKPEGLCVWAWNDIFRTVAIMSAGGNFSKGIFEGWMKDENTAIACCTDGIRPVVFKIEKIED